MSMRGWMVVDLAAMGERDGTDGIDVQLVGEACTSLGGGG